MTIKELLIFGFSGYEKLFLIFCNLLGKISDDPRLLLFATSLLINYLYARVILRQGDNIVLATIVYFSLGNYLYNLNIMRQAIAVGIVLNAIPSLIKKEYIKYCMIIMLATGFHTFSVTCFLLILPVHMIKNRKQLFLSLLVLTMTILSSLQLVHVIVLRFFKHFDYYFRNNYHSDQHFGLTSFAYVALEVFTILLMLKAKKRESVEEKKLIVYSVALIAAACGLIMMPTFGIYERIAKFFQPFLILAIPFSLRMVKKKDMRYLIENGIVLFSIVYYLYIVLSDAYKIVPFSFYT